MAFESWLSGAKRCAVLTLVLALAACGGGGSDSVTVTLADAAPASGATLAAGEAPAAQVCSWRPGAASARTSACVGQLLADQWLNRLGVAEIEAALAGQGSYVESVTPRYAVNSYRLEYLTTDVDGRPVRASGLVSVPQKSAGAPSPVLSYQHGTIFQDAKAPSNHAVPGEVAVVLASLGFIVVAPDYVGFGVSKGTPHPYLLSSPTAASTIDLLHAAQAWRRREGVHDNGQLFLTGYSQGGYATMAAHRTLQASGSPLLAQLRLVVAGAGPYDVQATLDGLVDVVRSENRLLGELINPGFLRYLPERVRNEVRRLLLRALIPEDTDVVYDTRFLDSFLADDTEAIAASSSVHDWAPQLGVRLFHGRDDRTVPYASSTSTVAAMQARGAGDQVSLRDCRAVPSGHIECVPPFISFMLEQMAPLAKDL